MSMKPSQRASSEEQIDAETTENVPGDHRAATGTGIVNHIQLLLQQKEQVGGGASGETLKTEMTKAMVLGEEPIRHECTRTTGPGHICMTFICIPHEDTV